MSEDFNLAQKPPIVNCRKPNCQPNPFCNTYPIRHTSPRKGLVFIGKWGTFSSRFHDKEEPHIMNTRTIKKLLAVVKGIEPADTVIVNGKIVNVFTNRIDEGRSIVIKDGYIASVEDERTAASYKTPNIIDAGGQFLSPGFIDAHTHIDGVYPFYSFVPYALKGGTTTVVTETSATACSAGMTGVMALMEGTKHYPVNCFFLAPPLTPPFPTMETSLGLTLKEFSTLLKRDDVVGVGEAYWTRVVDADRQIMGQVSAALAVNKPLDGHAAGAKGKKLIEYVLTGITSCHESITVDEAMEKLNLGLYIMIREGFVRRELPELSKLKDLGVDTRRLILVSDSFDAVMLSEEGYLDSIARRAVEFGFTPLEAIKMMTINPADYYGLRHLGAIAPLRRADILFLRSLDTIHIDRVMSGGKTVVESGTYTPEAKIHQYPERLKHTIKVGHCTESDFRIKAPKAGALVRVLEIASPTITREIHVKVAVRDGFIEKDLDGDILPVAMINKAKKTPFGQGLIKGTGIKEGAVATTLTWDTGNILVIGSDENDMACAVNRLADLQGGVVIVKNGRVIYEFPMELFGIMSLAGMEEIKGKIEDLAAKLPQIGTSLAKPFLNLQTIPFTGLPFLRITDKGLADIRKKKLVGLAVKARD